MDVIISPVSDRTISLLEDQPAHNEETCPLDIVYSMAVSMLCL